MTKAFRTLLVGLVMMSILAACGGATGGTQTSGAASTAASTAGGAASTAASTAASMAASTEASMAASTAASTASSSMASEAASPSADASEAATGGMNASPGASGAAAVELPAVNPGDVQGPIIAAGSSTVFPLAQAVAESWTDEGGTAPTIDSVGSGGGFERFCKTGEIDIANASRAIKQEETQACSQLNPARAPIEFRVGTDAIVIAVSADNTFLTNLTNDQLQKVFSTATNWSDVDPSFPSEAIQRFIPGTDSGTFDFFAETVFPDQYKAKKDDAYAQLLNAKGLQTSEDDNVLVQGIEGSPNAIGFFGFAYYQENKDRLKAISIEGVEPNEGTAESGDYELSRPLFIYSDAGIMQEKPQVAAFINFFLTNVNDVIGKVGYFPASEDSLNEARQKWLDAAGQ